MLMGIGQRGMAMPGVPGGSGLVLVEFGDKQRAKTRKRGNGVQVWTNDIQDVGPMTTVASICVKLAVGTALGLALELCEWSLPHHTPRLALVNDFARDAVPLFQDVIGVPVGSKLD